MHDEDNSALAGKELWVARGLSFLLAIVLGMIFWKVLSLIPGDIQPDR